MADLFESATTEKNEEQPTQEAQSPAEEPKGDQPFKFTVGDREYDEPAAVKKITEADSFIEQLLQEKRELEAQFEEVKQKASGQSKLDEALELLRKQQNQNAEQPSQETPTVDQSEIMEMVRKLAQEEARNTYASTAAQQAEERNVQQAMQSAKERFGDSYADKLLERGKALGMEQAEISEMASKNPSVFKELFIGSSKGSNPAPSGSVNSRAIDGQKEEPLPTIGKHWNAKARVDSLRQVEEAYRKKMNL